MYQIPFLKNQYLYHEALVPESFCKHIVENPTVVGIVGILVDLAQALVYNVLE